MGVTARLGWWQLSRAHEKIAIQAAYDQRSHLPSWSADTLVRTIKAAKNLSVADDWVHQPVAMEGVWLSDQTVYLDNRQMQGRPGFFVLTPLRLQGVDDVVLVQRGWIPRNFQDRAQVVAVNTPTQSVKVVGHLSASPSRLFEFQWAAGREGLSRIRQNLDLQAYRAETGLPLLPVMVVQTVADMVPVSGVDQPLAGDGLSRQWPVVTVSVDKNYGYAFQWFGLCALIALLYVWFQLIRPARSV